MRTKEQKAVAKAAAKKAETLARTLRAITKDCSIYDAATASEIIGLELQALMDEASRVREALRD
jgi:hypothetical protein